MKAIGYLLLAGIVLSVLKAALAVVLGGVALLALWGILFRPREMAQFAAVLTCWWLLQNYPAVTLVIASVSTLRALMVAR